jgi:hypothetical protein
MVAAVRRENLLTSLRKHAAFQWFLWGLALLVLGWMYVGGAVRQGRTLNTTLENTDQAAYLEYAVNLHHNGASHIGNRNQMPLYPFLQSLVYDPGLSIEEAFSRGKTFNTALSVLLLAALGIFWGRRFPAIQAAALLLVTSFTVFVFRAPYIQVELLYYVLSFFTFWLLCRLLEAPSWRLAVVTGLAVAVTHLAKAAALPALALFLVLGALRVCWTAWRARGAEPAHPGPAERIALRQAGVFALVPVVFLVGVSPYLITSARVYGSAFYNVNSTFYMWYDTWADARRGTIRAGDRFTWPALPAEALPGPLKYVQEHTPRQIAARFRDGLRYLFGESVRTYGYWKYVVFYGAAAFVVALLQRQRALERIKQHPFVVTFVLGYLGGYLLLYAWYVPIAAGNRLLLALFLPFMFASAFVLHDLTGASAGRSRSWLFTAVHIAVIAAVALELHDILTHRIVTVYGGS